ncbi:hypothetical protein EV207_10743 [Scopulibacillus darangshiensis]|uniref:ABC-2 type transport system permease protein n=1 Tax=Scopulibacillus darangshiensis TaxID=442528 RepID=A0A4R2P533_9BACL|nr:hypothetical protein [Scopulibacillus darangshiensis]TCP29949.1 hypothetical protein EV207_10743 [Scopulibacillus darangshiensis]
MKKRPMLKLFFHDFTYGFSYGKHKYIVFYSMIGLLSLMISFQLKPLGSNSIATFFLLLKDNGYIKQLSDYQVPFYWDFIQFSVLFLIGDFLFQDIENKRIYLLLRSRSKSHYILSKIFWVVVQNILIYIGLFTTIYIISSLALGDFSLGKSPYFKQNIVPLMVTKVTPGQLLLNILLGFIITSVLLSSILLLFIQFSPPIMIFFGVIVISSISTFSSIKWLPAIHSMILKRDIFNMEHHLTLGFSIIYCLVLYAFVTTFTFFVFKKIDTP